MGKPALLWPNERMRAFFVAVLGAEPGIDAATAERLAQRCIAHINRMLVTDDLPASADVGSDRPLGALEAAALVRDATAPAAVSEPTPSTGGEPEAEFDPYVFSVVVTLSRKGKAGLMARLEEITSPTHLRQLADAQHIGLDPALEKPQDLRLAILAGAEQRIADRRAAAS
jgi:hypothetical protein